MRRNPEAEILQRTFRDRLTVERKMTVQDPDTGESLQESYVVYDGIPCAYSQKANQTPERQETHGVRRMDSTIFTQPGIFIQDNDVAVIITEAGQTFTGICGHTFGYISHGETPFAVEAMA